MSSSAAVATYTHLLEAWNRQDAAGFAALFTPDGLAIGFDGSTMDGPGEVERQLAAVFAHHRTAAYVAIVRSARAVGADTVLLHAAVGMVPPGGDAIDPAVNALQCALVVGDGEAARIALLQTTPAAFHGRPQLVERLTAELTEALRKGAVVTAG